jgi:hypothetical protein
VFDDLHLKHPFSKPAWTTNLRKTPRPTKLNSRQSEGSSPSTSMISLPIELVDKILNYVLRDLLDQMVHFGSLPLSILAEFRTLYSTCKTFNHCLEHSRPKLYLGGYRDLIRNREPTPRYFYVPPFRPATAEREKEYPRSITTSWPKVFQRFQCFHVNNVHHNFHHQTTKYYEQLGKFWLNPSLKIGDLPVSQDWRSSRPVPL